MDISWAAPGFSQSPSPQNWHNQDKMSKLAREEQFGSEEIIRLLINGALGWIIIELPEGVRTKPVVINMWTHMKPEGDVVWYLGKLQVKRHCIMGLKWKPQFLSWGWLISNVVIYMTCMIWSKQIFLCGLDASIYILGIWPSQISRYNKLSNYLHRAYQRIYVWSLKTTAGDKSWWIISQER